MGRILYVYDQPGSFALRVCGLQYPPWFSLKDNSTPPEMEGPLGHGILSLARVMNFNFTLFEPPEKYWGLQLPNGSWSGLAGLLHRNEADYSIGPFAMTYYRTRALRHTVVIADNYLTILVGKTDHYSQNIFSTILTFDWQVWLLLWVSLIFYTGLSTFADTSLTPLTPRPLVSKRFWRYFSTYFASLFCEGYPHSPVFLSSRMLLGVWWMAAIVLMNGFSGNLKATLMTTPSFDRIKSLEDVVARPSLRPLIQEGTTYEAFIKANTESQFVRLWSQAVRLKGIQSYQVIYSLATLQDVMNERAVIVSDILTLKYFVSIFCSDLRGGKFYFGDLFFPHTYTMAVSHQLDSRIYKGVMTNSRRMVEAGLFKLWLEKEYSNWEMCMEGGANPTEKPLAMGDLSGVFIIWLIFLSIALVVFISEMVLQSRRKYSVQY